MMRPKRGASAGRSPPARIGISGPAKIGTSMPLARCLDMWMRRGTGTALRSAVPISGGCTTSLAKVGTTFVPPLPSWPGKLGENEISIAACVMRCRPWPRSRRHHCRRGFTCGAWRSARLKILVCEKRLNGRRRWTLLHIKASRQSTNIAADLKSVFQTGN